MEEMPKTKYAKFARMFVDLDRMEKVGHKSTENVPVSVRIEYIAKVFFFILLALFLAPIILVVLGIGGSDFRQAGFMIPMALFPILVFLGAALSFSKTYKKTNKGIQSSSDSQNETNQ